MDKGGIYLITCGEIGWVYVGSTTRFDQRAYTHRASLERRDHHCQLLQKAYDQTGAFAFVPMKIVSEDEKALLRFHEQRLIVELRRAGAALYNHREASLTAVTTEPEFLAALETL